MVLLLFACEAFKPGEIGWAMPEGVWKPINADAPTDAILVVAVQPIAAGEFGLFDDAPVLTR